MVLPEQCVPRVPEVLAVQTLSHGADLGRGQLSVDHQLLVTTGELERDLQSLLHGLADAGR